MVNNEPKVAINAFLPDDVQAAALVGRAWIPGTGPAIITFKDGHFIDITCPEFPTVSFLMALDNPAQRVREAIGRSIGLARDVLANSIEKNRRTDQAFLLSPIDLQAVKAAGVTFAASLIERVIEERTHGDAGRADQVRADLQALIGGKLHELRPGSEQALIMRQNMIEQGLWSQYLEVGFGPDAEIFTKCQPMSSVGFGANIGIRSDSVWNNPEPEIVLVVSPHGKIVGVTLGNDVNLRDFEGRSALLLGKAKDNNASCSIGPFIRLFDGHFALDDVRKAHMNVVVRGLDGFELNESGSMTQISRDPLELVEEAFGQTNQYPDGFVLFVGSMFAPIKDRDVAGSGFTHKVGDEVIIASERLGKLTNRVQTCSVCKPWTFGLSALMKNLAERRLL